jgi:glycine cleavage system H protein
VKYPLSLRYSKNHHWVKLSASYAVIGITRYAQVVLGQIQKLDLPTLGLDIDANKVVGRVSGATRSFELCSPLDGTIIDVHSDLIHQLHLINSHPHSEGWLIRMEVRQPSCFSSLMNATDYRRFLQSLH